MPSLRFRLIFAVLILVTFPLLLAHSDVGSAAFALVCCLPLIESWRRRRAAP